MVMFFSWSMMNSRTLRAFCKSDLTRNLDKSFRTVRPETYLTSKGKQEPCLSMATRSIGPWAAKLTNTRKPRSRSHAVAIASAQAPFSCRVSNCGSVKELPGFVPPVGPPQSCSTSKQLKPGNVPHEFYDTMGNLIRLAGMLSARCADQSSDTRGSSLWLSSCREETKLVFRPCPVPHAGEKVGFGPQRRRRFFV